MIYGLVYTSYLHQASNPMHPTHEKGMWHPEVIGYIDPNIPLPDLEVYPKPSHLKVLPKSLYSGAIWDFYRP
jgi:hypothetical protein